MSEVAYSRTMIALGVLCLMVATMLCLKIITIIAIALEERERKAKEKETK